MSDDINCVWYLLVINCIVVLFYYQYNLVLTIEIKSQKVFY